MSKLSMGLACVVLSATLGLVGCTPQTNNNSAKDKMSGDKMDKMSGDKMSGDKMSGDKMSGDKMNGDKMSGQPKDKM